MNFRILNFVPLLGALLLAACGPASRTDALLSDIESYITDAPDSARTALAALDTTALRTKRLRARYSLLRTMAQVKCYDDITIPGLLDDAAWFARHGSPDEKLNYWYCQGRIHYAHGLLNETASAYSHAEANAESVRDQHALGLLYVAYQTLYGAVYNRSKQQEYAEKACETFKRTNDPMTQPSLGMLAMIYSSRQEWAKADSLFREAIPSSESAPVALRSYLFSYAQMKLLQPEPDPAGALALLNRYRELNARFGVVEKGVYAFALELLGRKMESDPIIAELRGIKENAALVWLARIDKARGDYESALLEQEEVYRRENATIQQTLEDSVTQTLRDDAAREAERTRASLRQTLYLSGFLFFAMLSLVLLLLRRKGKIKAERDRLVDLREQMQEELEKAQVENAEKAQLISGQEDRIREMEEHVAREREIYTRERVNRLRQLGELRSTFWWRERGGMREADAIQQIKKEISYVYQTDNDGGALIRRLDNELDGAISQLRKSLHLRGKPKEVLFICCCILDLEPEMIAEIMDTTKSNVYAKRFRLRAKVRALNDPLLSVLVEK